MNRGGRCECLQISSNAPTLAQGERILRLVTAAYVALGGRAYRVQVTNWLEARGVVAYATMMGFRSQRFGLVQLTTPRAACNRVIREAVVLAKLADGATAAHRLALTDLHAAKLGSGSDSILYAYRAVEAIRQAISPGPGSGATWAAMHRKLGADQGPLRDLADTSTRGQPPRARLDDPTRTPAASPAPTTPPGTSSLSARQQTSSRQ